MIDGGFGVGEKEGEFGFERFGKGAFFWFFGFVSRNEWFLFCL